MTADKLTIEHILEAKALLEANTDWPTVIDHHIYVSTDSRNPRPIVVGIKPSSSARRKGRRS